MGIGEYREGVSDIKYNDFETYFWGQLNINYSFPFYLKPIIQSSIHIMSFPGSITESLFTQELTSWSPRLDNFAREAEEFPLEPCPGIKPLRQTPTGALFHWASLFWALPCLPPHWEKSQSKENCLSVQMQIPVVCPPTTLSKHTNTVLCLQIPIVYGYMLWGSWICSNPSIDNEDSFINQ